jgi:hypothetical protein
MNFNVFLKREIILANIEFCGNSIIVNETKNGQKLVKK